MDDSRLSHTAASDHSSGFAYGLRIVGIIALALLMYACQRHDPDQQPKLFQLPAEYLHLAHASLPAQLPMPVEGIKPRQIDDTWGALRGSNRKHQGVDIFAKRGTAVLSTTEGKIMAMDTTPIGGKVVWVLGPAMSRHYYAHLNDFAALKTGQWIKAGTVIGYVGNTGNAKTTPPHLHYGIYLNTHGAVNPYPYLAKPDA